MGNWRTVNIVGTIAPVDVQAAREFVNTGEEWNRFHPLCNYGPSLCGLGDWVAETMRASGNLSERDYSVEDVADTLRRLVAVAPSLQVKVHCGGDYEANECVATVTVADGAVLVGSPEVGTVGGMAPLVEGRLASFLTGGLA